MILTHRTFKGLLAGAIVAVAAGSGPVYADDLAEIYNAALQNDPVLGQARANYLARTEVVPQSRAALLPTANVSVSRTSLRKDTWLSVERPGWQRRLASLSCV